MKKLYFLLLNLLFRILICGTAMFFCNAAYGQNHVLIVGKPVNLAFPEYPDADAATKIYGRVSTVFRDYNRPAELVRGMVADKEGNVFYADEYSHKIYKISAAGILTTFAGTGVAGVADGTANVATFNEPGDMVMDRAGNIYLVDEGPLGGLIRKITPDGVVSRFAGITDWSQSNHSDREDNVATASIISPYRLAISPVNDDLYYTDFQSIKIISKNRVGWIANAIKGLPYGNAHPEYTYFAIYDIAVDKGGKVYFFDQRGMVSKIEPGGGITTLSRSAVANDVTYRIEYDPRGFLWMAGDTYITKFTLDGTITPFAGAGARGYTDAVGQDARFISTENISLNGDGNLYVMRQAGEDLRKVEVAGLQLTPGQPAGLTYRDGAIVGTPTSSAPQTIYTANVYNATNSFSTSLTFSIVPDYAFLSSVAFSVGTPSPQFSQEVTDYTFGVPNNVSSITLTPTAIHTSSTITVNGAVVASGSTTAAIPLQVGINTITVNVTAAAGGSTRNYTFKVTRVELPPVISYPAPSQYTKDVEIVPLAPVNNGGPVAGLFYTPIGNVATIGYSISPQLPEGSGLYFNNETGIISGTPLSGIAQTKYTITARNTGGASTAMVTISVLSNVSTLQALTTSAGAVSPAFSSTVENYQLNVPFERTSVTVNPVSKDGGAVVKVNGTVVNTGAVPAQIPLAIGDNPITINVTAQNGIAIKTYTLKVNRAATAVTSLSTLGISSGVTLTPSFSTEVGAYAVYLPYNAGSFNLQPVVNNGQAVIKVNGAVVSSGSLVSVPAVQGSVVNVEVIPQDSPAKTYKVSVVKELVAPVISYLTPQKFTIGTSIQPLAPANGAGAVPAATYNQLGVVTGNNTTGESFSTNVRGLTTSLNGNIYAADTQNGMVQMITPAGVVTTIASGLNIPTGIAADALGNIYVAESGRNRIIKITPEGAITTFAGSGDAGTDEGQGAEASFSQPYGLAVDKQGNVYVADSFNNRIRKISPEGIVSTVAGNGNAGAANGYGSNASFNSPQGLTIDPQGNLYIADYSNNKIRTINLTTGLVSTLAGSGTEGSTDGTGAGAAFNKPIGVVATGGKIYVIQENSSKVRVITMQGQVVTLAFAGLITPVSITADALGTIYMQDRSELRSYTPIGYTILPALPDGLTFDNLTGIISGTPAAVTAASDYTVTAYNGAGSSTAKLNIGIIADYTLTGLITSAGAVRNFTPGINNYKLKVPAEVANITITPTANNPAAQITINGVPVSSGSASTAFQLNPGVNNFTIALALPSGQTQTYTLGISKPTTPPQIFYPGNTLIFDKDVAIAGRAPVNHGGPVPAVNYGETSIYAQAFGGVFRPSGITFDNQGNLYATDSKNSIIHKVSPEGTISTFAGTGQEGLADGLGTQAGFNGPLGITTDKNGNMYVADGNFRSIRKITLAGVVTTLARGLATSSRGITTDTAGNIFVSQVNTGKILKISPEGTVTNYLGSDMPGLQNGTGTAVQFRNPGDIAADAMGNLYIADTGNGLIRKIDVNGIVTTYADKTGTLGSANGSSSTLFDNPAAVTVDKAGNVYVAELYSGTVWKVTPGGIVSKVGNGLRGSNMDFTYKPLGLTVDDEQNIYLSVYDWGIFKIKNQGYAISEPLPAGLTFDSRTGVISGTPTAYMAPKAYTVTAYNEAGSSQTVVTIGVVPNTSLATLHVSGTGYDETVRPEEGSTEINRIVPFNVTSVTLSPTAQSAQTSVTVNGAPLSAGQASLPVTLNVGLNVITTVVTAADSVTKKTYTLNLTREGTSTATLTGLTLSTGTLSPVFSEYQFTYNADVLPGTQSVNISAMLTDTIAVMTINGSVVASGAPATIALTSPLTTVGIEVAASNTVVKRLYVITINKPSGAANLASLHLSNIRLTPAFSPYVTNYGVLEAGISTVVTAVAADTAATITVNGTSLNSGAPSQPITFATGVNDINVKVSGKNGVDTNSYIITVFKPAQVPVINYPDTAIFRLNAPATALHPVNTGGAIPAVVFGATAPFPANGNTTFNQPGKVITDAQGNLYLTTVSTINKITRGGEVSTVAGRDYVGLTDGKGTDAAFNSPDGMAVDILGNIYVADKGNNAIRKIDPLGNVTTVAGTGAAGAVNGPDVSASFSSPEDVAIDRLGNIYVADSENNLIRKIDTAGLVSTFAGTGAQGAGNGYRTQASFNHPVALVFDREGNLYVADQNNFSIRKITPDGTVSMLAGNGARSIADGTGTDAGFDSIYDICIDTNGDIYVADEAVRRVTQQGEVTTISNIQTVGIATNNGQLYIADGHGALETISLTGYHITPALPQGLQFDSATGIISGTPVAPMPLTNYKITGFNAGGNSDDNINLAVYDKESASLAQLSVSSGELNPYFDSERLGYSLYASAETDTLIITSVPVNPYATVTINGVALAPGTTTTTIALNSAVTNVTISITSEDSSATKVYTIAVNKDVISSGLSALIVENGSLFPAFDPATQSYAITVSNAVTNVSLTPVAADAESKIFINGNLVKNNIPALVPIGKGLLQIEISVSAPGSAEPYIYTLQILRLSAPPSVTYKKPSFTFVVNTPANAVLPINKGGAVNNTFYGEVSTLIDFSNMSEVPKPEMLGFSAGPVTDKAGNSYISDATANVILKTVPGGSPVVFAGSGIAGAEDGVGNQASFRSPKGLAIDNSGNIYVADAGNNMVRMINPQGVTTTVAGTGVAGAINGAGNTAAFNNPMYLLTLNGELYVWDDGNRMMRKVVVTGYTITPALPAGLLFNAGTGEISGKALEISSARDYKVTAYNIGGSSTTSINVKVVTDANLNVQLSIIPRETLAKYNGGPADVSYRASVSPLVNMIQLLPKAEDPATVVTVNGVVVATGAASNPIILLNAETYINVVASRGDSVSKTYSILITKTGSNNTSIKFKLSPNTTLIKSPGPANTNYITSVPSGTSALSITPIQQDTNARVYINGLLVANKSPSSVVLNNPVTTVNIEVHAQDSVTIRTYSITITKNGSNNALASFKLSPNTTLIKSPGPANTNYITSVPSGTSALSITPIQQDTNARVYINGLLVANKSPSSVVLNNPVTTVNIEVHAQDSVTIRTYSITITKNGSNNALASFKLSPNTTLIKSPGPANTNYITSVPSGTSALSITPIQQDTNARVYINGLLVANKSPSSVVLNNPVTTVNIEVHAQDSVTIRTYSITITKNGSNNANAVFTLSPNAILIKSKTGPANINYITSVDALLGEVMVKPKAADEHALITVNGLPVANKSISLPIPLNATGPTIIGMQVTAQDGVTVNTYSITVLKNGSNNANAQFSINPKSKLELNEMGPAAINYITRVTSGTTAITVTPKTRDANARVTISGVPVANQTSSIPLQLTNDSTYIDIQVTAQDGVTQNTYSILVIKEIGVGVAEKSTTTMAVTPPTNEVLNKMSILNDVVSKSVSIYPNPFVDKVNINLKGYNVKQATIEVRDLQGRVVFNKILYIMADTVEVPLANLNAGVYFIKVSVNNEQKTYKIIKT